MIPSLRHLQRSRPLGAAPLVAILTLTALLVVGLAPARVGAEGVNIYSRTATGDVPPLRAIAGALTGITTPEGCNIDPANNELWVANNGANTITVYSRTATGNVIPLRTIGGAATGLNRPIDVNADPINNEVFVANALAPAITVYARTANGNVAPIRTITGAATGITNPFTAAVDTVNNEVFVLNLANQIVRVFSRTANGNVAPLRSFNSPSLNFAQELAVDPVNNEILLTDTTNNNVQVFSRTANGTVAALRTFSVGTPNAVPTPVGLYVDTLNNEIGVVNTFSVPAANSVAVFSRTATGAPTALRRIQGFLPQLNTPIRIALDPVNNEFCVTIRDPIGGAAIPTLSEWGMAAMVALLVLGALWTLRRRSTGLRPA